MFYIDIFLKNSISVVFYKHFVNYKLKIFCEVVHSEVLLKTFLEIEKGLTWNLMSISFLSEFHNNEYDRPIFFF
jgi:hypothetical protein